MFALFLRRLKKKFVCTFFLRRLKTIFCTFFLRRLKKKFVCTFFLRRLKKNFVCTFFLRRLKKNFVCTFFLRRLKKNFCTFFLRRLKKKILHFFFYVDLKKIFALFFYVDLKKNLFALFFYIDLKKIFALFFYVDLKKIFEEEGLDLDPILSTKRTKLQMATDSKFADFGIIIGRIQFEHIFEISMKFPFQPYKACPNRTSIKEVMAPSISDTLLLISRLILNVKKKSYIFGICGPSPSMSDGIC